MRPLDWFLIGGWIATMVTFYHLHKRTMRLLDDIVKFNAFLIREIRKLKGIDPPEPGSPTFWAE